MFEGVRGKTLDEIWINLEEKITTSAHVWLQYIPLPVKEKPRADELCWSLPYRCQIQFYWPMALKLKSCGVHLVCLSTSTELDPSGSNFVILPPYIDKFINLWKLDLHCCKWLCEIPELSPKVNWIDASECESLETYSKLSMVLEEKDSQGIEWINLWNCHQLCDNLGFDVEKMESILLNQVSTENSRFGIVCPGGEVPKGFDYCKDVEELICSEMGCLAYELSIEIPGSLKWENTGLALCAVFEEGFWSSEMSEEVTPTNVDCVSVEFGAYIWINNVYVDGDYSFSKSSKESSKSAHVRLQYIPLPVEMKAQMDDMCWLWLPPYTCQVQFYCRDYRESRAFKLKSCGVHLVCQQDSNDVMVAVNDTDLAGAAVYQSRVDPDIFYCSNFGRPLQSNQRSGSLGSIGGKPYDNYLKML